MSARELTVVPGVVVRNVLDGNEELVIKAVADAYLAHGRGQTRCPGTQPLYTGGGRFFAMPGSIDDAAPVVGMKWVASYVHNVTAGAERASAMLVANDAATGRPVAVVDGTLISAKRTAAGAAVALRAVGAAGWAKSIGFVGCGPINYEVLRFARQVFDVQHAILVDLDPARAGAFAQRVHADFPSTATSTATLEEVLESADVVSIATTATVPHIASLPKRPFVVLHLSLRDLSPEVILNAYNIVDDAEHVCSARTSIHLTAESTGHRNFIHATLPSLVSGETVYERPHVPTVVSPFGLSVLDLAVLREVLPRALEHPDVIRIANFGGGVWS
jgi:N-[(2S)-2-amino-2-carboxyethyl]-L-glutamate dehydrogenase